MSEGTPRVGEVVDEVPDYAAWGEALRDGWLLGQEYTNCGHVTVTPKAACVRCGSRDQRSVRLPEEGAVTSVTTINVAPETFEAPYQVAVVDLGDASLTVRIDGTVDIGDDMTFVDALDSTEEPAPVFES